MVRLTLGVDTAALRKLTSCPADGVLGRKTLLQALQLPAVTAGLVAGHGLHQVSTAALASCREVCDLSPPEFETWKRCLLLGLHVPQAFDVRRLTREATRAESCSMTWETWTEWNESYTGVRAQHSLENQQRYTLNKDYLHETKHKFNVTIISLFVLKYSLTLLASIMTLQCCV